MTGKRTAEADGKEDTNQHHHKKENNRQEAKEGSKSHLEEDLGESPTPRSISNANTAQANTNARFSLSIYLCSV